MSAVSINIKMEGGEKKWEREDLFLRSDVVSFTMRWADGKNKKQGKKPNWSYFFFAESPLLHFTIRGLFASKAEKKNHAMPDLSHLSSVVYVLMFSLSLSFFLSRSLFYFILFLFLFLLQKTV